MADVLPWEEAAQAKTAGSDNQLKPWEEAAKPGVGEDVVKTIVPSAAKGVIGLAGLGGDLQNLLSGIDPSQWVADKAKRADEAFTSTFPNVSKKMHEEHEKFQHLPSSNVSSGDSETPLPLPTSKDIQNKVEQYTGPFYEPKTAPGRMIGTAAEVAPSLFLGGETGIGSLVKAIGAGVGSEGAAQGADAVKGYLPEKAQPYAEPVARAAGAVAGSFTPAGARRTITPLPMTDEQFAVVNRLRQTNPELVNASTAGQLTDTPGLRTMEGRTVQNGPQQEAAFTQGAMRTMGAPGQSFPEAMAQGDRLGAELRTLRDGNNINSVEHRNLINDARNNRALFASQYGHDAAAPIDEAIGQLAQARATPNGPVMTGQRYGMLLQDLQGRIEAAPNSQTQYALGQLRDRLKQAFRNSVPPDVANREEELARQYANYSALSRVKPEIGRETVTPQEVLGASSKQQGAQRTNRNQGDLAPLAQDASRVMTPLPPRNAEVSDLTHLLGTGIGGILGGAAEHGNGLSGIAKGAFEGSLPGLFGVPHAVNLGKDVVSRGLNSDAVQAYLRNQGWRPDAHTSSDVSQIVRLLAAPPVNRISENKK